jgi:hypothetical protein
MNKMALGDGKDCGKWLCGEEECAVKKKGCRGGVEELSLLCFAVGFPSLLHGRALFGFLKFNGNFLDLCNI